MSKFILILNIDNYIQKDDNIAKQLTAKSK